jgi:hypothetical protein
MTWNLGGAESKWWPLNQTPKSKPQLNPTTTTALCPQGEYEGRGWTTPVGIGSNCTRAHKTTCNKEQSDCRTQERLVPCCLQSRNTTSMVDLGCWCGWPGTLVVLNQNDGPWIQHQRASLNWTQTTTTAQMSTRRVWGTWLNYPGRGSGRTARELTKLLVTKSRVVAGPKRDLHLDVFNQGPPLDM